MKIDLETSTNWCVMWLCITVCCCTAMTFAWLHKGKTIYDCTLNKHKYSSRYETDTSESNDNQVIMSKGISDGNWSIEDQKRFIELCRLDQGKYLGDVCEFCGKSSKIGYEKDPS